MQAGILADFRIVDQARSKFSSQYLVCRCRESTGRLFLRRQRRRLASRVFRVVRSAKVVFEAAEHALHSCQMPLRCLGGVVDVIEIAVDILQLLALANQLIRCFYPNLEWSNGFFDFSEPHQGYNCIKLDTD